jgi:hypothetical protein
VLYVVQAVFAIFSLEYINYAEHYGLTREANDPLSGRLAWGSNGFMTNAMTLNITRHAHHYVNPGVPYLELEHLEAMPLLPAGYFALFFPRSSAIGTSAGQLQPPASPLQRLSHRDDPVPAPAFELRGPRARQARRQLMSLNALRRERNQRDATHDDGGCDQHPHGQGFVR